MAFELTSMSRSLMRTAAVAVVGLAASACSVVPSWMGGDSKPAASAADQADQQDAAAAPSPDLSAVPDKPTAPSTGDDQKTLSDSLGADRAQNQYSADQLRGGTEAAAPPPGAPPPDQTASTAAPPQPAPAPASDSSAPAPDTSSAPAPAGTPPSDSGSIDAAAASNAAPADQTPPAPVPPAPQTATAEAAPPPPAVPPAAPSAPAVAPQPAVPSSSNAPAVPASSYGTYGAASTMVSPSDAALGFKPSMAPPLNASVAQFVPPPIIARYQQTAAMSRSAYSVSSESAYSATPVSNSSRSSGGAVVANLGSAPPPMTTYMGGGTPAAVVAFAGDRTVLDAQAKEQVHAAAASFMQSGGQGYIRVVGHAASAGNLSSSRHMTLNLEHSQARATAVARELIKNGVPADRVLVEASGDNGGGASAEIFLQS
jgi:outer membrane protein OmpA-like peptidoglycan-associated protein